MATGTVWERGTDACREAVCLDRPAVLAVSGGADSMVMATLLHARAPQLVAAIATFDHGTGYAAQDAVSLVEGWASARGIAVHIGRADGVPRTEAAWRQARWAFLRRVSADVGAPVATAHTADDQAETVFMRLLRGSGVRGLAGLLAPGQVLRPLLDLSRAEVRALATADAVPFLEDPSNGDLRYLRNRVRLELLPALERTTPGFRAWLLSVGVRSAGWRRSVADAVDTHWRPEVQGDRVTVPRGSRPVRGEEEGALFWPEVAGRVGVTLDWRGTARLASFTTKRASGLRMPLSGGAIVTSARAEWSLQRAEVFDGLLARPIGGHHGSGD